MSSGEQSHNVDRLVSHRDQFRGSLIPMTGPLLRHSDLNDSERSLLKGDFLKRRTSSELPDHLLYLDVMHSWGVMCPHPQSSRRYEGIFCWDHPPGFNEFKWYSCEVCECAVINK